MPPPEFSERTFEFCFNFEFKKKNADRVIGIPYIPTLREESYLGYDVEFKLKKGLISHSLFLQHKVSNFVENRTVKNWEIFDDIGGPYYWFYLKKLIGYRQHNLLYNMRLSGEDVSYSAPKFYQYDVLTQHAIDEVVTDETIFIDPLLAGEITDFGIHKFVYNTGGTEINFYSEPKKIRPDTFKTLSEKVVSREINEEYFSKLFETLKEGINKVFRIEYKLPVKYIGLTFLSRCIYLLSKYYKLHWLMF